MESSSFKKVITKVLLWLVALVVLAMVAIYFIGGFTYSEGNRAGLLIKFSKKGYLFKTSEGELNIGGLQPTPQTVGTNLIWTFSVKDKAIAEKMMNYEGKYVSLHYREVVKNFFWQGDTKYFVDEVEEIKR
jgi:hypothetical protein